MPICSEILIGVVALEILVWIMQARSVTRNNKAAIMARESKLSIYAALVGNLAIASVKFIAGYITASAAMLSEAIHSCVDTGNQGLLLLGISKSKKPADFEHPYGHGREIYFWSFVVAVAIFAVGGGLSIYEGLRHIAHPATLEDPFWNYVVLGCAFVFESASWLFGWRVFRSVLGSDGPWQAIRKSKDPTTFIVVFEDTGALLGLIIAFAGVFLGHLLNNPYLDATASLVIGLMLSIMSVLLAYETKGLLIGEGFEREILHQLRGLIARDPSIDHVRRLLTLFFGPEDVMMTVEVKFRDDLSSKQISSAVARIKAKVRAEYPVIKRILLLDLLRYLRRELFSFATFLWRIRVAQSIQYSEASVSGFPIASLPGR